MEWCNAEDELVAEQRRWWDRWTTRRQLRTWRDQETAEAIRHVQTVLLSWMLLLCRGNRIPVRGPVGLAGALAPVSK